MISPAAGVLLIADPFLKDPHFMRSVVIVCEHQKEGTVGFVLNKPFDQMLDALITSFEGFTIPVYYGGPVQKDTIHFLHQYPDLIPGGQEIMKGIYWGGDFEQVMELLKENRITQNDIQFFLGYSGWGEQQLENELKEKSWITREAFSRLVFHRNIDAIWKDALIDLGGEYSQMPNYPIDPQLN